jgi:hypothetical protein
MTRSDFLYALKIRNWFYLQVLIFSCLIQELKFRPKFQVISRTLLERINGDHLEVY